MEMFLTILATCSLGLVLCVLAVAGSRQSEDQERVPDERIRSAASAFFVEGTVKSVPRIPADVLCNRIERHVRSEQRAAERFLEIPTAESLHSGSSSPFLN